MPTSPLDAILEATPDLDPAVFVPRLLAAARELTPTLADDLAPLISEIPPSALTDREHAYWGSAGWDTVIGTLFAALETKEV